MKAEPQCTEVLLACYSKESTVISKISFDNQLWTAAQDEVKVLLERVQANKVPTQRTVMSREVLPKEIDLFLENCVELIIEVPSVRAADIKKQRNSWSLNGMPYEFPLITSTDMIFRNKSIGDVMSTVDAAKEAINQGYNLCRLKAKELYVAVISNAKRKYDPQSPLWFPVFYGCKGGSFSREEKRRTYDTIMDACIENNIQILSTAFDGECFSLLTQDKDSNPLTLIQLQHKVFEEVKALDKREILKQIEAASRFMEDATKLQAKYLSSGKVELVGPSLPKNARVSFEKASNAAKKVRSKAKSNNKNNVPQKNSVSQEPKSTRKKAKGKRNFPATLFQQAKALVSSQCFYKAALNEAYAEVIWPKKHQEWEANSHIVHGIPGLPANWFCVPEYNKERKRLEHKIWDATHIITNIKRVVCTSGTRHLRKTAWHIAAKDPGVKLKLTMVTNLPDKQDIGFALTTFSEKVEEVMKKNDFHEEAMFCALMRNWWIAEDEPGISAKKRLEHRVALREYLLKDVNFGTFPPITEYVKDKLNYFDCYSAIRSWRGCSMLTNMRGGAGRRFKL